MSFAEKFKKDAAKVVGVQHSAPGPRFWISTGSYIMNKIISGDYLNGIGQGKLAMLVGPSGAGKSFITGNIIKSAQEAGYGVYVIDSENALDDAYLEAIGVDINSNYIYSGVSTIAQTVKMLSKFLKEYRDSKETLPFLIVVDSLDAMLTDGMKDKFEKGETVGDQGQHVKQLKAMLAPIMQEVKDLDVAVLCTKQVFKSQKLNAGNSPITEWEMSEALLYAFSQVLLITRLLLKNESDSKIFDGITLRVFGRKTRFTKPFQRAAIAVPYSTGMDPYTGVLEAAVALGVVTQGGAWYTFGETKFQSKNFANVREAVLEALVKLDRSVSLDVDIKALEEAEDSTFALNIEEKKSKK